MPAAVVRAILTARNVLRNHPWRRVPPRSPSRHCRARRLAAFR